MNQYNNIQATKVKVEMPNLKNSAFSTPAHRKEDSENIPVKEILLSEETNVEETSSELFLKHNKAINMSHYELEPKTFSYRWTTFCYWIGDKNPFAGYRTVGSADEYINMHRCDRRIFGFWYLPPLIVGGNAMLGSKKDRDKVDLFLKHNYTFQYYTRKFGSYLKYKFIKFKNFVRVNVNPRQKWLTKKIPKDWCDKTHLIPILNFEMVIDFVEREKALDVTDWEASGDQASKFEKELKDCYDYIKFRRPKLEERHFKSYPDEETVTGDYHVDYAENNQLENEINTQDTKYLTWLVVNRDFFWT